MLIHEKVASHAALRPEAIAVRFRGQEVTFAQLDGWADSFARSLIGLGARPGDLVCLLASRSDAAVAAILGVLKAGCAYVPIDPAYPRERIRFILEDAGSELVCTLHDGRDIATLTDRPCLDLATVPRQCAPRGPLPAARADDLAYISYTSGSTGTPKGVMIEHRSVAAVVPHLVEQYGLGPDDRALQYAPLGWDTSASEIFRSLWAGSCLCVAPEELSRRPDLLAGFLAAERVTKAVLPAALLRVMRPADLPLLDTLISSGERCTHELVDAWAPGRRLLNAWGSTEGTFSSTVMECRPGEQRNPPIGAPIPSAFISLRDEQGKEVAQGEVGEIHLGGAGISRGYYNRPDLTAERFVPADPSDPSAGRLFRTGDLGRLLPDGNYDYVGRADEHVKVRGFRLELGEVETVLRAHPSVADAAVVTFENRVGGTELAAYVVAAEGWTHAPTAAQLRDFVAERLPEFMVPRAIELLDQMPLNAHGKRDKRRLEQRAAEERDRAAAADAGDKTADRVAEMWRELLGVANVGPDDDFFDLGGHSIFALALLNQLAEEFGVEVTVADLFGLRTVANLSSHIDESRERNASTPDRSPLY